MKQNNFRYLALFLLLLALPALACGFFDSDEPPSAPDNAAVVNVLANSSLQPWLSTVVAEFNDSEQETESGRPIYIQLTGAESGQAVLVLSQDSQEADIWIPESAVWVDVLVDQGNEAYAQNCTSIAESPLVIAMWRPMAESLGWPGLPLGWLDIGSLAADPSAWAYYSGGEYGDSLRMSHAHLGLAGSGTSTLLAIVQAAQSKTDAVTPEDISQPIVQASVGAFESAVSSFNSNSENLGQTMAERGPSYLGAGVMYESTIVKYGNGDLVAIYPLEGTFMATHPACVNQSADAETIEAAGLFRDYLLSETAQEQALAAGLRPVNPAVAIGAPIDEAHGVDPSQPEIIFNEPQADAVYAIQDLWQAARKPVNLVMLLDTSGSMRGVKIDTMKEAAEEFVQNMGDEDTISLVEFYTQIDLLVEQASIGSDRQEVIEAIRNLEPGGDTSLFDAIGAGAQLIQANPSPDAVNAIVILTDGMDTSSSLYRFDNNLIAAATAGDTTVFTIAYGDDADKGLLSELAARGNGNFYLGDEASIAAIYEEMSAAFGGTLGVGR
ncbi:MAG: VWA domain-containing protein [Candidatus Promineifilaceae bacterium]|jgi:Ca-activated chloride channel family protein